eukprot:NODE_21203_length_764_cov_4.262166.p2 GENE.NODE_21203_length_764_cov_4.262166~~NODE_21203_length_764_cov_4.262166.p2  ORF type:complete len:159 (-),score=41.77 NODE_21203_length_764_cov_4.262166:287-694(-)
MNITICSGTQVVYAFMQPDPDEGHYTVQHWNGTPLMTLRGNFETMDVIALRADGQTLCTMGPRPDEGDVLHGTLYRQADAVLVLMTLAAAEMHMTRTHGVSVFMKDRNDDVLPTPTDCLSQTGSSAAATAAAGLL